VRKIHIIIDLRGNIPTLIRDTDGNHYSNALDEYSTWWKTTALHFPLYP